MHSACIMQSFCSICGCYSALFGWRPVVFGMGEEAFGGEGGEDFFGDVVFEVAGSGEISC